MSLQDTCEMLAKRLPHKPLPPHVLVVNDIHAGAGDDHDPLMQIGNGGLVNDVLEDYLSLGYSAFLSEIWDIWRGQNLDMMYASHPKLRQILTKYGGNIYEALGNHERDVFLFPLAHIFEGFGKKIFFDHGFLWDWPNCEGWKIGRWVVQAAVHLDLDPATSPHLANEERHFLIRSQRRNLAMVNPDWEFISGHTHDFEHIENYHVTGCGYESPLKGFLIEEGEFIPFERS